VEIDATDISRGKIFIYGSLNLPLAMIGYPLIIWVPRLYATDIGLSLALIGTVLSAAAISDAITDPVMGYITDRFRTRWGRRKPWIFVGLPLWGIAIWMLLNPAPDSTIVYLAIWFILLRAGSTLWGVPFSAWGAELSVQYHTRTRIQSAGQKYMIIGLIGGSAIPLLVEWFSAAKNDATFVRTKFGGLATISESIVDGIGTFLLGMSEFFGIADASATTVLSCYSFAILVLLPLSGLLVLKFVPEMPALPAQHRVFFLKSLKLIFRNGLFRRILIIEILICGGENFRNALSLFFMQDYIGVRFAGEMYVVYFVVGLFAIVFWDNLARRYGKHRSLAIAMVFVGIVSIWIFMLEHGDLGAFYILFALKGFCFGAFQYLPRAMLADVVDIDTARSADARPGSYFAILGFMTKAAASLGALSLPILALVGYNATRGAQVQNGPSEILWLGILYAIVPTVLFALAFYMCWTWPLTGERHARIQKLLLRRNTRIMAKGKNSQAI